MSEQDLQPVSTKDALVKAVADLWSQVIQSGEDYVIFYDHYGNPARIRKDQDDYYVAWAVDQHGKSVWDENGEPIENPRHAALLAFQGPVLGRTDP